MSVLVRSFVGIGCASTILWACSSLAKNETESDEQDLTVAECQANARAANESCMKLAKQRTDAVQRKQAAEACTKALNESLSKCATLSQAPPKDGAPPSTTTPKVGGGIVTEPMRPDAGPPKPDGGQVPPRPDAGGPTPPTPLPPPKTGGGQPNTSPPADAGRPAPPRPGLRF